MKKRMARWMVDQFLRLIFSLPAIANDILNLFPRSLKDVEFNEYILLKVKFITTMLSYYPKWPREKDIIDIRW